MRFVRWLRSYWPWLLLLVVVIGALFVVPDAKRSLVLNTATLVGVLLLAVPAIRINEQGKAIERVRSLQVGISAIQTTLADRSLKPEVRERQTATLSERRELLQTALDELTIGKGAWTPLVHRTLYGGYVLVLGASVARLTV